MSASSERSLRPTKSGALGPNRRGRVYRTWDSMTANYKERTEIQLREPAEGGGGWGKNVSIRGDSRGKFSPGGAIYLSVQLNKTAAPRISQGIIGAAGRN